MAEIVPRVVFVTGIRRPVISFYTSSRAKFSQALAMFGHAGLTLSYRAHDARAYDESYEGSTEDLLTAAVREIERRGGSTGSFFFVEDTSIRIEALSGQKDVPGLEAKEWFAETTFEDLNRDLDAAGDRRCVVKSAIALSVPGLRTPKFFYGETAGEIVKDVPRLPENVFNPWLSPESFSAWFIPSGADKVLSAMEFEESLRYDFRGRSLTALIDRLEEYATVLNLGPSAYTRRHSSGWTQEEALFSVSAPIVLVVGPTCSGKTTFGNSAQLTRGWTFVDASSIVKVMREERGSQEEIGVFAAALLDREGGDVVARYISREYVREGSDPTVITGFRAIEEVEFFREKYRNVLVVSLSAPQRLRYERFIKRNSRDLRTFSEFQQIDEQQHRLGLLRVADELADLRIENVLSPEEYAAQIESVIGSSRSSVRGVTHVERRPSRDKSQLYRSLAVLRDAGRPLTTQEIAASVSSPGIRPNNANKMLRRYPELAQRQESPGTNVRYNITQRGLAFLSAMDRLAKRSPG